MKILIVLAIYIIASPLQARNRQKCYPYCPKYTLEQMKNLDLAAQLPRRPDLYKYRVKGTYRNDTYFTDKVPVYKEIAPDLYTFFDFVELGKEVELEKLASVQSRMFYQITIRTDAKGKPVKGWIDGRFVEGFAYNGDASLNY